MRAFGVRPKRDLGQNFLIDSNILGVIERAAELAPEDVVLEIGGGLGVLSEHLAERVAHVHVVELDRALRAGAARRARPVRRTTTLHLADAMALDLAALRPGADEGRREPALRDRGRRDPAHDRGAAGVTRWVAMVQKEVGERFAAAPGSGAYGVPSVLAQLACDVRVLRPISRTVFLPVPNVDSVLVGLERRGAGRARRGAARVRAGGVRAPAQGARAARSRWPAAADARRSVRAALEALGQPADVRAERLAPEDLRELCGGVGA